MCCRSALTSQWLFQLYLALECDVWIGTRNSNWNRLIDEMRCGSRHRAPRLIANTRRSSQLAPLIRRLLIVYETAVLNPGPRFDADCNAAPSGAP